MNIKIPNPSIKTGFFLGLFITVLVVMFYVFSFQEVIINLSETPGITIDIYKVSKTDSGNTGHSVDGHFEHNQNNLIKSITNTETLRLKKGRYVMVSEETNDYSEWETIVDLDGEPKTVLPDPEYSDTKLAMLLNDQKTKLHNAIIEKYSPTISTFNISQGQLLQNGTWYITTIKKRVSSEEARLNYRDIYRVALKIDGDEWVLATRPDLILNKFDYPDIPEAILTEANKLK